MKCSSMVAGAILAGGLLLGAAGAQSAPDEPVCQSGQEISEAVLTRTPGARVIATFAGDEAADLIAGVNELPPATDYQGDRAVVFGSDLLPNLLVLILDGECKSAVVVIDYDQYDAILVGGGIGV